MKDGKITRKGRQTEREKAKREKRNFIKKERKEEIYEGDREIERERERERETGVRGGQEEREEGSG